MKALILTILLSGCARLVETPSPRLSGNLAVQIPGNPGFFYSPYALGVVWIDATGLPSGSKTRCPITGKIIVLP